MIPWLCFIASLVPKGAFGLFSGRSFSLEPLLNVRGEHMYFFFEGRAGGRISEG